MAVMDPGASASLRMREIDEIIRAARAAGEKIFDLAAERDHDGAVPNLEIKILFDQALLLAPFPSEYGGMGLGSRGDDTAPVMAILAILGGASLPLGRLFEGHLNAVSLVARYGSADNLALLHKEFLKAG